MMLPAAAGTLLSAAVPFVSDFAKTADANLQGRTATAGLNTNSVFDTLNKAGVTLDPAEQARIQATLQEEQTRAGNQLNKENQAFGAALGTAAGNLASQRSMALNSQQNKAQAALDMMRNTAGTFGNAMNNSAAAMQGVMGAFAR